MCVDGKRTCVNPLNRVDRVDYIEDGDLQGRFGQGEAAALAALREYELGTDEGLKNLGEIRLWNLGSLSYLWRQHRFTVAVGQDNDCSECIFGGFRYQGRLFSDIWICLSKYLFR